MLATEERVGSFPQLHRVGGLGRFVRSLGAVRLAEEEEQQVGRQHWGEDQGDEVAGEHQGAIGHGQPDQRVQARPANGGARSP